MSTIRSSQAAVSEVGAVGVDEVEESLGIAGAEEAEMGLGIEDAGKHEGSLTSPARSTSLDTAAGCCDRARAMD